MGNGNDASVWMDALDKTSTVILCIIGLLSTGLVSYTTVIVIERRNSEVCIDPEATTTTSLSPNGTTPTYGTTSPNRTTPLRRTSPLSHTTLWRTNMNINITFVDNTTQHNRSYETTPYSATTLCVRRSDQVTMRRVLTAQQTDAPIPNVLLKLFGHDLNIFAEDLILASQFIVSALSITVVVIHILMLKCKCSSKLKKGLRIFSTWIMLAVAIAEGVLFDCGSLLAKWGDFYSTDWLDITLSAKAVFSTFTLTIMASIIACKKQKRWVCCRLIGLFVEYLCLALAVFTLCVTVIPADAIPPQYLTAVLAGPLLIYFLLVTCVCCCRQKY